MTHRLLRHLQPHQLALTWGLATVIVLTTLGVAQAHGGEVDIVVESVTWETDDGYLATYAIALTFADGDPAADATVEISAEAAAGAIGAQATETEAGVYVGAVTYSTAGQARLTVTFDSPDAAGSVEFTHDIGAADRNEVTVSVDTVEETRAGTTTTKAALDRFLPAPLEIPGPTNTTTAATAPEPTTTTTIPTDTSHEQATADAPDDAGHTDDGVVLDLPGAGADLPRDIGLRLFHLLALGLWFIPVGMSLFGVTHRLVALASLFGMSLTVLSGVSLSLYSAPLTYPGLFRWTELGNGQYGGSYQAAFIAKMAAVVIGAVATIWWYRRKDQISTAVTLGAAGAALVAVTAMGQFHLLSHF